MRISELAERMQADGLLVDFFPGHTDIFDRADFDSREIEPGNCFVAIRGQGADGHAFIDKAVKNGAVAIVCEAAPDISREGLAGAAVVRVRDSRRVLLWLASMQAGQPADRLTLVGTTGTNGKTTVASLVQHVLSESGLPCGFIGTTGYNVLSANYTARETTPSPLRVYSLFSEMIEAGCKACSMEVSSHALAQWRVDASHFDVAVFTNLTRDHLDYHVSMEDYRSSKKRLFDGLNRNATAVVNADDSASVHLTRDTRAQVISFGTGGDARIRYRIQRADVSGLQLQIDGQDVRSSLTGHFNAANLAAVYTAALGLDLAPNLIVRALETASTVPGRFEVVRGTLGRTVVVDYAHTPDALENVLQAARRILPENARLWCVFGCGGDRDAGKRPLMGAIAERLADQVVVTSDNPRSESPEQILMDIRDGMSRPDQAEFQVDRRSAIVHAARHSGFGDLIVIAGKGHESVQVIGDKALPFDDRSEAMAAFEADGESGTSSQTGVAS